MNDVDEVKNKIDIVDVVRERVELKKAGRNFKGLCPFHTEKTPSFMVNPELQIFKCFGCGEGGDAISFIQKFEGLDFYEALKLLADKAGIKLKPISEKSFSEKEELYQANEQAARFYNFILLSHPLGKPFLNYALKEREISQNAIDSFHVGAAPDRPNLLFNFLTQKKGFSPKTLEKAGLIYSSRNGYFDRFRGRLIFPIFTPTSRICALAGRILPGKEDVAKYINSPETPIYHKGSSLFGLNITRSQIKRAETVIVVEGELDLISIWQIGVKNAVAIKGTALTEDQIHILSRFAQTIILALDADFAGDKAALRGFVLSQEIGLDVLIAQLKKFKDPDDYARADPEGLVDSLKHSIPVWDFLIDSSFSKYKKLNGQTKGKLSREIIPWIASIPDSIVKAHYIKKVANRLDVPEEAVLEKVNSLKSVNIVSPKKEVVNKAPIPKSRRELLEEDFLFLILNVNPKLVLTNNFLNFFKSPLTKKIANSIFLSLQKNQNQNVVKLKSNLPSELQERFINIMFKKEDFNSVNLEKDLVQTKKELQTLSLKEELQSLSKEISRLENKKSPLLREKQQKFQELSSQLAKSQA